MANGTTIIEAKKVSVSLNLTEAWRFRELLYFLAWRDVKVKYKQTAIGVIWAILQPVLMMIVFTLLFGRLAAMPSNGMPYPVFVYLGLLPWQYFASVVGQASSSIVTQQNLITKIYFPRVIIPASAALSAFVDFAMASVVLAGMMIYYGVGVSAWAVILPAVMAFIVMSAVGFGMWFSALNVRYRDVQYVVPFLLQVWMFVTPVVYPLDLAGDYAWLLALNPMAGAIEAARGVVTGSAVPPHLLAISFASGVLVFVSGIFYFNSVERKFADIV